jgi:rhamnulokinase
MTAAAHVAFDLGAESGRAVVGRFDGERIELEELRRFPTQSVRLPDGLYWSALGLLAELQAALGDARAGGVRVRAVGIDSWGVDFGLLDRHGTLVANPLSYRDGRAAAYVHQAFARVAAEEIYATTGIQFLPINTLFQLVALAETGGLERAETLLLMPDLLAYWLTGERHAEATNASTTQLLDARNGLWADELIERLGLPTRLFPPVVEPGSVLGGLLPHVAAATGLPRPTPVAVVASHDTASAVLAAPLASPSAAYISSGTWSLVGVEWPEPVLTPRAQAANLTNERGFAGTTRLLRNVMGLWLVQECRRAWLRERESLEYAELAELAASAPAGGPLFDPDLPELLAPENMPARIAELVGSGERSVLLRAIFESLACKYRFVLRQLEDVTGSTIDTVHVIGGGARNDFLCRLTAHVTRRPVFAGPVEAAALGNVLAQLHAFGDVGSAGEMRELVRRSTKIHAYEPDPDGERWNELYDRFMTVLDATVLTR